MDWEMTDAECKYDAGNAATAPNLSLHIIFHANPC